MTEYLVPTRRGTAELVEKRSRFIGEVFPVESEEQARACIEQVKKGRYDARHHCWCYRIHGGTERYADDGEPQGTAGQPMLGVFQREGIENVCCVVTRYFGGILLGAGGLVRAYAAGAKRALDAAGISVVEPWAQVTLTCPYALLERVKQAAETVGGVPEETLYGADVTLTVRLKPDCVPAFTQAVTDLTSGGSAVLPAGTIFRATERLSRLPTGVRTP